MYQKLNLGIPYLWSEWKALFSKKDLAADVIAGITVAFIAIPLSLAIALASNAPPETGLVSAVVAGIICVLFGGTPLSISGPAAAMSVLVADIIGKFGFQALVFMGLIAGLMQLISGILGLGRLARYVPLPVISGFTAGIGIIIMVGQLPRAFGLIPPPESHVFTVLLHIRDYFHTINGACLFVVMTTMTIIHQLPKLFPKIPPILPAVAVSALIVYFFKLNNVALIGSIPGSLPAPQLLMVPNITFNELMLNAFVLYVLASLETLLSSSATDKLSQGKKHDPNQELIGQGLGNIAVSFFRGIPVTGVIARSATNIRAGAKTRRSSIIHSLIILSAVYVFAPLISMIPIAALAGVLLSVAASMINYKEFYELWRTSRTEGIIYATTFLTIILVDLIAGVQAGIIAAAVIVLWKATRTYSHMSISIHDNIIRCSLMGTLTFLSAGKIAKLEKKLKQAKAGQTIVLDLSSITNLDTTGANAIIDFYNHCTAKEIKFYLKGLSRRYESIFEVAGGEELLKNHYVVSEQELRKREGSRTPHFARGRLIHGVNRFFQERKYNDKRLFDYITHQQDPHTLFIGCSDSRVIPSLITSSDPGELFIIRNVGNFIPPYQPGLLSSEAAAIEFALTQLNISDIVVCGHTNCGAISACQSKSDAKLLPELKEWIQLMRSQLTVDNNGEVDLNEIARRNVINQIHHLRQYPIVQKKLAKNKIVLHGWFFDFDKTSIYEWDEGSDLFYSLVEEENIEDGTLS